MTVPTTGAGPIWMHQIRDEFRPGSALTDLYSYYRDHGIITGNPENAAIPLNTPEARPGTGGQAIYFSHFSGAYKSYAGSSDKASNGTRTITIPSYAWLRIRCWGAGAGGTGVWAGVTYNGGSGGASNVTGFNKGNGGKANNVSGTGEDGNYSNTTGAGSNGGAGMFGSKGGDGGYSRSEYGPGYGRSFTMNVGNGGNAGAVVVAGYTPPQPGTDGRVLVEWGV